MGVSVYQLSKYKQFKNENAIEKIRIKWLAILWYSLLFRPWILHDCKFVVCYWDNIIESGYFFYLTDVAYVVLFDWCNTIHTTWFSNIKCYLIIKR